jgi:uncharacterized SAM-binding protein YcdF (DUF218 family)
MSGPRLIAVCGYSDGTETGLHPICVERLQRAEREAGPGDVVLLSGWARHGSAKSEAELMARSWSAPCDRVVVDSDARSTLGNVAAAARLARAVEAREVLLVTSRWHARRALALLRRAMRGSTTSLAVAVTDERPAPAARARELACWAVVPFGRLGMS